MKKSFLNNYALIMLIVFIVYNLLFSSLRIGGKIYQIFMCTSIILNCFVLLQFRKEIKYKQYVIITYFFLWFFAKDIFFCIFALTSMLFLMLTGFFENIIIKILLIISILIFSFCNLFLFFAILLKYGLDFNSNIKMFDVYENTHYYCERNYEAYAYSLGAMDSYHYSIGKHYEFLNIDGIIYIAYNKRNEKTHEEYKDYISNHKCYLVGEKYES